MKVWVDHMVFFFGSIIGLFAGWIANSATGYSLILTLPTGWFLGVFFTSYIGTSISEVWLRRKVSNLPALFEMFAEINQKPAKLTEWEREFIEDINSKCEKNPGYLGKRATMKQVNIIAQIYVERIRGANLKGREYTLESSDPETGEIRTITIGSNK